MVFKVDVM